MRRFVHRENVKHLEDLLSQTTDQERRQQLLRLLQEEKTSLLQAEAEAADPRPKALGAE